jgi:hypothetical protein
MALSDENFLQKMGSIAKSSVGSVVNSARQGFAPLLENTPAAGIGKAMRVNNSDQLPNIIKNEKNPNQGAAGAQFPTPTERDWRVKLSIPNVEPFISDSHILQPLRATNGLVFPYTPTVLISHSAGYNALQPTHSNYPYQVYSASQVDQLVITGDFFVQNGLEAQYWVAALHYLRSVTKMFYGGSGEAQGAPPPIVYLDGYGDYIFNNVPVVITTFTIDMPDSVDYIATEVHAGSGKQFHSVKRDAKDNKAPEAAANQFYGNEALETKNNSWAPSQSMVAITCQPLYSRTQVEAFSLESFVRGGYVGNRTGFI